MYEFCVHVRVRALPEVGDLLLSMSTDCWLSDSSVRPDGGDQQCGEKVSNRHPVRYFEFVFFKISVINAIQRSARLSSATRDSKEEIFTFSRRQAIQFCLCWMSLFLPLVSSD